MNILSELDLYTPEQLDRLHDEARHRAVELRNEAIATMWDGISDAWSAQQASARRSATRLASSLARHARLRASAGQGRTPEVC